MPFDKTWHVHSFPSDGCGELSDVALFGLLVTNSRTVPIHPGEILREEFLVPHKLSATRLARSIGVSTKRVTGITHGNRRITGEIAVLLAHVFKTTPEFWLNLQARHELETAQGLVSKERIDGAVALSNELRVG